MSQTKKKVTAKIRRGKWKTSPLYLHIIWNSLRAIQIYIKFIILVIENEIISDTENKINFSADFPFFPCIRDDIIKVW